MNSQLLITAEILVVVVMPLLFLYLMGNWPLRTTVPCLLSIPILWYLSYSPLHELSHVAATYLVGGQVVEMKLIPSFWFGEFGRAWITPVGITHSPQRFIMTASPYLLDIVSLVVAVLVLRRGFSISAFLVGLVFTLLCLRPAFDFVCETIAFLSGGRGDLFHLEEIVGTFAIWSFLAFSVGLSAFSILSFLRRFIGFPGTFSDQASAYSGIR